MLRKSATSFCWNEKTKSYFHFLIAIKVTCSFRKLIYKVEPYTHTILKAFFFFFAPFGKGRKCPLMHLLVIKCLRGQPFYSCLFALGILNYVFGLERVNRDPCFFPTANWGLRNIWFRTYFFPLLWIWILSLLLICTMGQMMKTAFCEEHWGRMSKGHQGRQGASLTCVRLEEADLKPPRQWEQKCWWASICWEARRARRGCRGSGNAS